MRNLNRWLLVSSAFLAADAMAQEWTFTPEIYSRGGVTYKSDLSRQAAYNTRSQFNLGPYNEEGIIDSPLTEVTLHAAYGDSFKFHYGVDVNGKNQFGYREDQNDSNKAYLAERVVYGEFKAGGGVSLWYGSRPFRSPPEFLSRAFLFDEKNILGGGVRIEGLGPLNADFAYGSKEKNYGNGDAATQELDNILINKLEYPLANGNIRSNFEYHRTQKTVASGNGELGTTGLIVGLAYQRWGDQILGGNLYNQLIVQNSSGFVGNGIMGSAFQTNDDQVYDKDKKPSKLLLSWNGDWKAKQYAVYWTAMHQDHKGKAPGYSDSEVRWTTLDGIIRPVYALTSQVSVGAELARRSVQNEGKALRDSVYNGTNDWATNAGATRWAGLVSYHLESKNFEFPTIGLYAGEIIKDRATTFFASQGAEKSTHFLRLYYEVKIN